MPWYWTDHLAGLLNATRPSDLPATRAWIMRPVAVRVEPGANPLTIAEQLIEEEDEPESSTLLAA